MHSSSLLRLLARSLCAHTVDAFAWSSAQNMIIRMHSIASTLQQCGQNIYIHSNFTLICAPKLFLHQMRAPTVSMKISHFFHSNDEKIQWNICRFIIDSEMAAAVAAAAVMNQWQLWEMEKICNAENHWISVPISAFSQSKRRLTSILTLKNTQKKNAMLEIVINVFNESATIIQICNVSGVLRWRPKMNLTMLNVWLSCLVRHKQKRSVKNNEMSSYKLESVYWPL